MVPISRINKVAFLGNYLPRKCGIATFTTDLRNSIADRFPDVKCFVAPVNDIEQGYEYPPEVRFEIAEQDLSSYLAAADYLNIADFDLLCVEHEFGIFGGVAGSHLLALLHEVRMPIVTTLHTILQNPNHDQRRVMLELIQLSSRVIVMSNKGCEILQEVYAVDRKKIDIIAHGIPDIPFSDSNFYKEEFGVTGKNVILTFGLLSPNKGLEYALQALPGIINEFPDTVFIVVGQTHPNLLRNEGELYRLSLIRMAQDLGVQKHVVFFNRFVELDELLRFIGAADIYITPYLTENQITSGTLAYAFGTGNAVVSTPYWHAEELLADGRGVLVPFRNSEAITIGVNYLLKNDTLRHEMKENAFKLGRDMIWSRCAEKYMESFVLAIENQSRETAKIPPIKTLDQQPVSLPGLNLNHLFRMSDSTGIFQHAIFTVPCFEDGYCTDDNARALLLTIQLQQSGHKSAEIKNLSATYVAFLNHTFVHETKRFRNFMSFDRRWLESVGSEDSHGNALWALGYSIAHINQSGIQSLATELFDNALPVVTEFTSPRAWALTLVGIDSYLKRFPGNHSAIEVREILIQKLIQRFADASSTEWLWYEDGLSYANAKIPHAMIVSGVSMDNQSVVQMGLETLSWLVKIQKSETGYFRPIGSNGFYSKGESRAIFDQQPIEAHATISACIEAYAVTKNVQWLTEAHNAFDWFLGKNDLEMVLYDSSTGGCRDGLHPDRVNQNEGCESTLAFLLALTEMQALQSTRASFKNGEGK